MPRSASVGALKDTVVVSYTVRAFRKDHPHQVVEEVA
jgi:CRP-like cAMP-binding protein